MGLSHLGLFSWAVVVCAAMVGAQVRETFPAGQPGEAWKLEYQKPDAAKIVWPVAGEKDGLKFVSTGIAKLERSVEPIDGPMEFAAEVELDKGVSENWRNNGINIALSSAPVDKMSADDWCVLFQMVQQGAVATVKQGGARWGRLRPNDARNIWEFDGRDIAPRFTLTMSGSGGSDQSVEWPAKFLDGTRLRFHAWRDAENMMRVTIHNHDAPGGPWWESEAPLPVGLREKPLKYLTVFISQEAKWFGDLERANKQVAGASGDGTGQGLFAGRVTSIAVARVEDGRPKLNEPYPLSPIEGVERKPGTPSAWLPAGGVEVLRQKFNSPAFAGYRTVLLRNAEKSNANDASADNVDTTALTWAYVLTGERIYFDRLLSKIDTQCGVRNTPPARKHGEPGNLRQLLDVREFQVHRVEALAQAYDLLYDELDPKRRDAMRRAMLRSLDRYIRQTDKRDWWYVNNPSNTIGVGNGANALIAVALRHEHPELAKKVIDRAVNLIKTRYEGVADDGGCNEGNMYWNYGMSFPLMLGYTLQNAEGNDRGLLDNPRIANAHRYVETNLGGDGKMIPFNDTQPWLMGWVPISAASNAADQPLMRWIADHIAASLAEKPGYPEQSRGPYAVMAFLFRDTVPAPKEFPGVPTLSVLQSINEGVLRSDNAFKPRLVTAIKGNGKSNTHHANEDQGSFVLYADGQMVLLDPGYFESGADKHSLPTVGDAKKPVLDPRAFAPIVDVWEKGQIRSATVDASRAYVDREQKPAQRVTRARRVFVQVAADALVVLEDILPVAADAPVTTRLQTGVAVEAKGPSATFTHPSGKVTLHSFGPALQFEATPRKWSKNWVYARSGVEWTTLAATYAADESKPVVMVFARNADMPAPKAEYSDGKVAVTVGTQVVTFARQDAGWQAVHD